MFFEKDFLKSIYYDNFFHDICFTCIFSSIFILYHFKMLDISQNEANLIGLGILLLTVSDLFSSGDRYEK
ncbi:hypothetical protein [Tepidibacter hydrothermalis]|uniref:Uncharacterized protein n=1 Tax=Tepidibacter hydrothermalis TaxID=3036126 RepID=A0ABY8EIT8_9FIRM|nr:hypothetical protein [Tepidibacter hydrothermalis]WFD10783.1 hypothetical protein P4S50_01520 [Tepidibacter hydrothermalis]